MALCCFSWIREVVDLLIVDKKLDISLFPDDIIIEILARLPAKDVLNCRRLCRQWESLTSTSYFSEMHLKRATPSLLMQFAADGVDSKEFICHEDVDEKLKFSEIHSKTLKNLSQYRPRLTGACHGLLLCEASIKINATKYLVINLITEEYVSLIPPLNPGNVCSIFFHPSTRDYIVLYWHARRHECHNTHPGYCYRYFTYALRAKTWKEITPCFSYRPTLNSISTVLVSGCLHWMVRQHFDDDASIPPCKDAIMVYSIAKEEFQTLSHPGPECASRVRHQWMSVFEVKEEVIFVHVYYKTPVIYIWVLKDYRKWGWVKRYEVDLGWMNSDVRYPPVVQRLGSVHPNEVRPLHIQNNELLFDWPSKGIFIYNLELKRVWKMRTRSGMNREHGRFGMAVTYTETFVSPRLLQC